MGKGISSGAFFSRGTSNSVGLQGEVIACGLSDFFVAKSPFGGTVRAKTEIMDGLPFLSPLSLFSALCLRTTSKNQMC